MADEAKPAAQGDIPVSEALKKVRPSPPDRIVIHPWPKVILSWPLVLVSIVFYFLGGGWWADTGPVPAEALGLWWMIMFLFTLLVQTFDFGRNNVIATFATITVILLGLYIWELQGNVEIYKAIYRMFQNAHLALDQNFYLAITIIYGIMFLFAFLTTRFDYWVLEPNRLMHKHGLLGDERQYATLQMSVEKEIPDLLEWLIFGGGRLIFKPGPGADAHKTLIVDNVFRVNTAEKRIRDFLGSIKVDEDRTK
jgi:hypothetical protein